MMTTMRPTMRPCSGTSLPAADDPTGVPVSTSPQVGGFIIWRRGAHDDETGLIGVRELQIPGTWRFDCSTPDLRVREPNEEEQRRTRWPQSPGRSRRPITPTMRVHDRESKIDDQYT
jgi:hypothetical protein